MEKEKKKGKEEIKSDDISKLKEKIMDIKEKKKEKQKEKKKTDKETIAEFTDTLQRLQAEFENYKKRVEREKGEFIVYSKADLIKKLLPILDTFEIALKNTTDKEKFVKGVEMIYAQLFSILEAEGLKPIEAKGKFDPYFHEVVLRQKSDEEEGIILEELQKGYMLGDRVLRHCKVKVSEKIEEKKEDNKPESNGKETGTE